MDCKELSPEVLEAARVNALLASGNLDDIDEMFSINDIKTDDLYEKKPRKKKAEAKHSIRPSDVEIEVLPEFSGISRKTINITIDRHEINYKEQISRVDDREVQYNVELVKNRKIAAEIAQEFKGYNEEERQKAIDGRVRYMTVVTYDNVIMNIKKIAYVKVWNNNGKIEYKIMLKGDIAKYHINKNRANKKIEEAMREIVGNCNG